MTKLKEKRLEIINNTMDDYGIYYGKRFIMSIWDLAYNINNSWNAECFINIKKYKSEYDTWEDALPDFHVYKIFNGIRHAVRGTNIQLLESVKNRAEYLIKE